jgi:hypothetical protein
MRLLLALTLVAASAAAGAPAGDLTAVRDGLLASGRGAREGAEAVARQLARTDPAGVASLWDGLDLQGRCLLVRALAAAGTKHAVMVAFPHALDPEPEVFRALLEGLADGGEVALFAKEPPDLPPHRAEALAELRLRWRLEAELLALKSEWGPTGHYQGQYKRLKALGPAILPVLLDITVDRARPLPGESAAGPYRSIHPGMARYDPFELRTMAAYAFGETVDPKDRATIERLVDLYRAYSRLEGERNRFARDELAPNLAFSLFDLGVRDPVQSYILELGRRASLGDSEALWNLGYAHMRIGEYEEGRTFYEQALEYSHSPAIAAYNLACSFSVRARDDERNREELVRDALSYLELSIQQGYGDWKWMEEDGDLSFIRMEPKYRDLLAYLQRKYPERPKGKGVKDKKSFLR